MPDDQPEEDRPDHAPDGEPEGRREALPDFHTDGALGPQGGAEVAFGNDVAEIGDELFRKGLVQPKILANQFHGDLIRFRPGGKARGIAGKHVHKQEHDHRDQKQCGQQPEEAFEKIVEHPLKPRRRAE